MSEDNSQDVARSQADILSAVAKAMGQVQKLAKGDKNKHDGYNFVSIDSFLALVNPICAESGLVVHMEEGEREDFTRKGKYGDNAWMRQSFVITLYHVSGQSMPPVTRTVEVLRNGAQAYGSAQSYALKQFWRCILLIPTGDKDDADFAPTDAGTVTRDAQRTEPRPDHSQAVADMAGADTVEDLANRWGELPASTKRAPEVLQAKDKRKAELKAAQALRDGEDRAAEIMDRDHDAAATGKDDMQDDAEFLEGGA